MQKHPIIEFEGVKYYKNGKYYTDFNTGKLLHRSIWSFHNGPIPDGMHIHHIDGDSNNNSIVNLEMLTSSEHFNKHRDTLDSLSRERKPVVCVQCGDVFMGGRIARYCSDHRKYKHKYKALVREPVPCLECGELYTPHKQSKYCSSTCKWKCGRKRRRANL